MGQSSLTIIDHDIDFYFQFSKYIAVEPCPIDTAPPTMDMSPKQTLSDTPSRWGVLGGLLGSIFAGYVSVPDNF